MSSKIEQPYGLWKSPITPAAVSQRLRLNDVQIDSDGRTLVWAEGRGSRGVLVARYGIEGARDLTEEQSVRGGVGYGGGEFTVRNGAVVFAEKSGRLFKRSLRQSWPDPITPAFGSVASPEISPDGRWVVYVFSDGHIDLLALVDAAGEEWPVKLVRGADFYMQPTWHPQSDRIAWVEWNHPNMPWDGTRLVMGRLESSPPHLADVVLVAGDQNTPAVQPLFSPDGHWLSMIRGNGEWENLELLHLESGERRTLVEGSGFNLALPAWVQGDHSYAWNFNSTRLYYLRYTGGLASLWVADVATGQSVQIETRPYTWLGQLSASSERDEVVFLASSSNIPERVVRWNGSDLLVQAYSQAESIPTEMLPSVREITWSAPDGTNVHGLFYAPANPNFTCAGLPPAIVRVHGGPTSAAPAAYSAEIAYFTSRGYAWLEVNHRGSTGYGRSFQDMLRERWGEVDVEDAAGGAQALAEQGLADGKHLAILGGSAGGYTVLNTLIRYPGLFKAGICLYGVSNLFTLAIDTHKFEERYTISLVGPLPQAAERYRAWSPVFHGDQIRDPLAIFQGADDTVVVPSQSESIVNVLRQHGVPHIYQLYAGEGHGFRKPETIVDYLEKVEKFLVDYVLFA